MLKANSCGQASAKLPQAEYRPNTAIRRRSRDPGVSHPDAGYERPALRLTSLAQCRNAPALFATLAKQLAQQSRLTVGFR